MKILILITIYIALVLPSNAAVNDISGSWMFYKAESPARSAEPYIILEFNADGKLKIFDMIFSTWEYKPDEHLLILNSDKDRDFDGTFDAELIGGDTLIITKDTVTFSFAKMNYEKVKKDNEASGLNGLWKSENEKNYFVQFDLPYDFLMINKKGSVLNRYRGEWYFDTRDSTVVIISFVRELKGRTKIFNLSDSTITLINRDKRFEFHKINKNQFVVEKLEFDFKDLEGREREDDKLPWNDYEKMMEYLDNIHSLEFRTSYLIEDICILLNDMQFSLISVVPSEKKVVFRNKIIINNDTMQTSETYRDDLHNSFNPFFPAEDPDFYKIVGTETVEVPAGKFLCTVVEVIIGEKKIKYWMINDKPGVFAKIITEETDPDDKKDYYIKELMKINTK